MLKEVYLNAKVIKTGNYYTTINEICDQVPALRPKLLWYVAHEIVKLGSFNEGKILCEEDKGAAIGATVSLVTGLPLCMARWYPYDLPNEIRSSITCEYFSGTLYINGIEKNDKITIVDDTISTGGTIISMIESIKAAGAEVKEVIALVEKVNNNGVKRVKNETDVDVKTFIKIEVDRNGVKIIE